MWAIIKNERKIENYDSVPTVSYLKSIHFCLNKKEELNLESAAFDQCYYVKTNPYSVFENKEFGTSGNFQKS